MCGIAGFIDSSGKNGEDVLRRITDTMQRRGPDDCGYFFLNDQQANIGLGHRRLSIIDTSSLGHQPMEFEDLVIVFNGEIYNYEEIRKPLLELGYSFTSSSDTEVVLKAFHRWGIDSVARFNGMFSIAIYDKKKRELYLVRDRLGIKPLYYFQRDKQFVFASELKPVMQYPGFVKEINSHALNMYLFHGYITAPHSIFNHVFKLEPGKYLIYKDQKAEIKTYWSIEEKFTSRKINGDVSEKEATDELDKLVTSSVKYRMIADVPLGCFLSGGIDSSLVAAVMQKLSAKPISTFTIGFKEPKFNEANYAKEVAQHLGTDHHEHYLSIDDAKKLIFDIPKFYDEPFADSSQLPTLLLSQFARTKVTVALSGDGGDELFCGYSRYDADLNYQKFKGVSSVLRQLDKIFPIESILQKTDRRLLYLLHVNNDLNIINSNYLHAQTTLNKLVKNSSYEHEKKYFEIPRLSGNIQEAHMLQDMVTYLPDDICTKVDRATMSVGLEGREPLLDYRIVEHSFSLPHQLKYHDKTKKYILKQLAYRYIPRKILDRPKMGFGVPIYEWLHTDLHDLVDEYFSKEFIERQNIFNAEEMAALIKNFETKRKDEYYARLVWHILVFQLWFAEYVKKT